MELEVRNDMALVCEMNILIKENRVSVKYSYADNDDVFKEATSVKKTKQNLLFVHS